MESCVMCDEVSNFGLILSLKCQLAAADLEPFLAVRQFLVLPSNGTAQKILCCEQNGLHLKMWNGG